MSAGSGRTAGSARPARSAGTGIRVAAEVADALAAGQPVVALESTIISHGLPRGDNLEHAAEFEIAVRAAGAVPATIAVVGGEARVGLDQEALEAIALGDDVAKVSDRDLAVVAARGGHGATTVAATAHLAATVGIRLLATGGIGGVHRDAAVTFDESADLSTLGRTPVTVVCAGVKSILDVGATLERLESLGVAVVGYGTDHFPGFYLPDSGYPVPWRLDSPEAVADVVRARQVLGTDRAALVVANPVRPEEALPEALHDRVLAEGLEMAASVGTRGKDVTPYLLAHFHQATAGASLQVNVDLVRANASLAARVAVALSEPA